jgi:hypothetical protein
MSSGVILLCNTDGFRQRTLLDNPVFHRGGDQQPQRKRLQRKPDGAEHFRRRGERRKAGLEDGLELKPSRTWIPRTSRRVSSSAVLTLRSSFSDTVVAPFLAAPELSPISRC